MPTTDEIQLSLCMIVRDEAELLPRFLEHAEGLWDELIVVDTGSTDDTVALLEAAGAEVFHRPWDDDFAAARNEGLRHARGKWIVYLDADEFVDEQIKAEIRGLLGNDSAGAATLTMRNELPHGHHRDAELLRMFRNDSSVRFRFPIHEELATSLRPYLKRNALSVVHLAGIVTHHGYVRQRAAGRNKKDRDLRILNKALTDNTDDLYVHFKRLELARYWDDTELWGDAARDALDALERTGEGGLEDAPYGGEMISLIAHTMKPEEAMELLMRFEPLLPPSTDLHYHRGTLHEEAGNSDAAVTDFELCLEIGDMHNVQMGTVRPLMGLCRVRMAQNDVVAAANHVEAALSHNYRDLEALLAAMSLLRCNSAAHVRNFVDEYIIEYGEQQELFSTWGDIALAHGDLEDAVEAFTKAAGETLDNRAALSLASALLRSGKAEQAHEVLDPLVEKIPEAGLGLLVCQLCLDRDSNLELDMDMDQANALLGEWVVAALRGADDATLSNIIKRVPTVEHVFPWLPGALGLAA